MQYFRACHVAFISNSDSQNANVQHTTKLAFDHSLVMSEEKPVFFFKWLHRLDEFPMAVAIGDA